MVVFGTIDAYLGPPGTGPRIDVVNTRLNTNMEYLQSVMRLAAGRNAVSMRVIMTVPPGSFDIVDGTSMACALYAACCGAKTNSHVGITGSVSLASGEPEPIMKVGAKTAYANHQNGVLFVPVLNYPEAANACPTCYKTAIGFRSFAELLRRLGVETD